MNPHHRTSEETFLGNLGLDKRPASRPCWSRNGGMSTSNYATAQETVIDMTFSDISGGILELLMYLF